MKKKEIFNIIKLGIINPAKAVKKSKKDSSISRAVVFLLIFSFIGYLILALIDRKSYYSISDGSVWVTPLSSIFFIVTIVTLTIVIFSLFYTYIQYLFLRLFKGKCSFSQLYHIIGAVYLPLCIIFSYLQRILLFGIGFVDNRIVSFWFGFAVKIIIILYLLVLYILLLKEAGQLSTLKAIFVWIIPFCLVFGLFVIILSYTIFSGQIVS